MEGTARRRAAARAGRFSIKPDPLEGPYFEESIYVTPSRLPAAMQQRIVECAEKMVRALGLTEGPAAA